MVRVWLRRLVLLALAAGIGAAVYLALRTRPVLVDLAQVAVGPMQVTINEEGIARVRDVYTLSSPIAGRLLRVRLDEGDEVVANQTVVAAIQPLDPPFLDVRARNEAAAAVEAARSAVGLAEAELESANAALTLAESEFERMTKLAGQNFVSESQLERAASDVALKRAQVASAQANVRLRQAELASAEARLTQPTEVGRAAAGEEVCCMQITAPVDGVVLKVHTRSEQAVIPGARIVEIGDPGRLEIAVDLLSADAVRLKPGGKALITDWGGETFSATIRRIDPAAFTKVSALGIEEQRVNALLDPDTVPPGLGHEYRVYARLVVWSADDVLTVPIGALFRAGGDWAVFAVADGTARQRRISIGHMNAARAQVTAGLEAGETVILYPSDLVADGVPVEVRASGDEPG
ncbi:MAG: secretion protein HlyD [Alphaproteobacteria bacterium]|nr:MAG: secretion protein HlyD [Alphaproteobacteria bacterium]